MSRARPVRLPEEIRPLFEEDQAFDGERFWMDVSRNGETASSSQIELLAAVENVDLDDLLDEVLTQGEVLRRLREALGQGPIPTEVLERQQIQRELRKAQPECRQCGLVGNSTRHHYINRWLLKELDSYQSKWADRSVNCIPLCTECHKALHQRDDLDKSVLPLLTKTEKTFADRALHALAEERPKLLILIARGAEGTYETRLVRDWLEGRFQKYDPAD